MSSSLAEERAAFLGDVSPTSRSSIDTDPSDPEGLSKPVASTPVCRRRLLSWVRSRPRHIRRSVRRQPLAALLLAVALFLLVVVPITTPSYLHPPVHYGELRSQCEGPAAAPGCANPLNERIFISVSLYDRGGHLAGGAWGQSLLRLIHLLGPGNVFLSIYENDSGPEGMDALEALKAMVPSRHHIVSDGHVPLDGFPNITMPDSTERMKRLAYLSEMRNRALRPLDTFAPSEDGVEPFDKVLFLNDVAFRPADVANLLFSTNIGPDGRTRYLATCALDFGNPFKFYDLYAQRDAEGFSNGVPIFPFFSTAGQGLSRADMLAQRDAVRVTSCWGGVVAMQARYVQNMNASLPRPDWQAIDSHVIDPDRPRNVTDPVRFRHEPEVFYDACECCLFLADVAQTADADDAGERGIYVNPYVRVAYDEAVLAWIPVVQRWERLFTVPHAIISRLAGLPRHNPHRTVRQGDSFVEEVWDVAAARWRLVERTGRSGMFCGVREMQLMRQEERTGDVNWANTRMPPGQALDFPT